MWERLRRGHRPRPPLLPSDSLPEDSPTEVEWMRAWIVEGLHRLAADPEIQIASTYGHVPDEVTFACTDTFPWARRVYEGGRFTEEERAAVDHALIAVEGLTYPDAPHIDVLSGAAWDHARSVAKSALETLGMSPLRPLWLSDLPGIGEFADPDVPYVRPNSASSASSSASNAATSRSGRST